MSTELPGKQGHVVKRSALCFDFAMAKKSYGKILFSTIMFAVLFALVIQYQNEQKHKAREAKMRAERAAKAAAERAEESKKEGAEGVVSHEVTAPESDLPAEKGPDPEYPTPELAGTASIFLLEEPDRGPLVTKVDLPDPKKLRWTLHAHCELADNTVICGPKLSRKPAAMLHYAKAETKGRLRMVERRRPGGTVDARWVLDYDPAGKLTQLAELEDGARVSWVRSFGAAGQSYRARGLDGANKLHGCGSMRLENDAQGRPKRVDCLQWNGQPMLDAQGVASSRIVRDKRGLVRERRFLDLAGKPTADRRGVSVMRFARDPAGREIRRTFFDAGGRPVISRRWGCHGMQTRYGADGTLAYEGCLDEKGKAHVRPQGFAGAEYVMDRRGCTVEKRYVDAAGEPTTDTFGLHKRVQQVDDHCRTLRMACQDIKGRAHACQPKGPAETRYRRDAQGRVISQTHHGVDGAPVGDAAYQVYELRKEWDAQDRLLRVSCWDAKGKPHECANTGFHAILRSYDAAGRVAEARFEDEQGKATTNLGTARRVFIYDNYDHQVYSHNRDAKGEPVMSMGMTSQRRIYDEGHRLFAVLLLDDQGKPARYTGCFTGVECPKGEWHAVRIMRGARGGVNKNLFFDAARQKVSEFGCARHRCWK